MAIAPANLETILATLEDVEARMFFATEFPVRTTLRRGDFFAEVVAWVKGMQHSALFRGSGDQLSNFGDEAVLTAPSGERLTLKECAQDSVLMFGARHEIGDPDGRIWRSEVTLKSTETAAAVRSRVQCVLATDIGRVQPPKKPYFVTLAIDDGWAVDDGRLAVGRVAQLLHRDSLHMAAGVILGTGDNVLPSVYISRTADGSLPLSDEQISSLAHRLAGVAHVLVEPSKVFSAELKKLTLARNPYGGSLGICVPNHGVIRKFYLGYAFPTAEELSLAVYRTVAQYVSNRTPRIGVDWQNIVDGSIAELRKKVSASQTDYETWFSLRDEENAEKDREISNLRAQIEILQTENIDSDANKDGFISTDLLKSFGPEIYKGELADRVRQLVVLAASGNFSEIDERSLAIAKHIARRTQWSGGANQLEARIKAAGRDNAKADSNLGQILTEIGFSKRHQGGHPVFVPDKLDGVSQQTLSTSASDHRAGRNAAQQIIRDLGLRSLME